MTKAKKKPAKKVAKKAVAKKLAAGSSRKIEPPRWGPDWGYNVNFTSKKKN